MTQEVKDEIDRLKEENGILKRCLKHEQKLSRKLQEQIDNWDIKEIEKVKD